MRTLLISRADDKTKKMTDLTFPFLKDYAQKCGCDFLMLDGEPPIWTNESPPRPHYRIMKLYNLLDQYDRILQVDCDVIINKNCPNIFDTVSYDCVGTIFEDVGNSIEHRRGQIEKANNQFGDIGWREGYINTGFFLVSRAHKEIFQPINGRYFMDFGYDDVHLAYNINKMGFKIHQLDYKWNHMTMFSEPWNGYANRFESNVIHYAGAGIFDKDKFGSRVEQIRHDAAIWQ
ncbi:MAG: hypothetical protein Q7R95_09115 [bacterium]|nr:hypothetical protein [bacterium]